MAVTGNSGKPAFEQTSASVQAGSPTDVNPVYVVGDGAGVTTPGIYELQIDDTDGTTLVVVTVVAAV